MLLREGTIHRNSSGLSNNYQPKPTQPSNTPCVCVCLKEKFADTMQPQMRSIRMLWIWTYTFIFNLLESDQTAEGKKLKMWHTEAWKHRFLIAWQTGTSMSSANLQITLSHSLLFHSLLGNFSHKKKKAKKKGWKLLDHPIADIRRALWGERVCQTQ